MFDIYRVLPNQQGTLDHILVAGFYTEWGDVIFVLDTLHDLSVAAGLETPVFNVGRCTHRKNSNHMRTFVTHIGTTDIEELRVLLGESK